MVSVVSNPSLSLELLHSHGRSKGEREEDIFSEQGKQGYLEVGDDNRWKADVLMMAMVSSRSRDQEIGQPVLSASASDHHAGIPTVERVLESSGDVQPEPRNLHFSLRSTDSSTATISATTTLAPSTLDATLGNVVAEVPLALHGALGYIVSKHPKVMSRVSTTLIIVGSIVLFPGVTACAAGTILAHPAVMVAGGVSVVVGKWLRATVHSVTANSEAQGIQADV